MLYGNSGAESGAWVRLTCSTHLFSEIILAFFQVSELLVKILSLAHLDDQQPSGTIYVTLDHRLKPGRQSAVALNSSLRGVCRLEVGYSCS